VESPGCLDSDSLPELPEGWAWARIEDLIVGGPSNGYSPKKSKDGSGSLALKLTATTRGSIDLSAEAVKRLAEVIDKNSDLFVKPGDLLFQRGNTIDYVGIAAVYDGPEATYVYPDLMIRVRTADQTLTQWIWRVANPPFGRKYMRDKATGTAGTMPKINGATLRNFRVPIPSFSEMVRALQLIDKSADAADHWAKQAVASQKAVNALRQWFEIRIRGPVSFTRSIRRAGHSAVGPVAQQLYQQRSVSARSASGQPVSCTRHCRA
jgi:type I restriction enzyme, S subunit